MACIIETCGARRVAGAFNALVLAIALTMAIVSGSAQAASNEGDLGNMTLEELANVPVTSVSKLSEPLRSVAASVYVISHDDINRSGATSIPEVLRLAPNLEVTQISASDYVVTARGFGSNAADQAFSNKLLVLIDGRSVYTPLFSGLYFDAQDVLLQDVDRIEIVSGPDATVWGANAVNGVINIITRSSDVTQGAYVSAAAGNQEVDGVARFGGKLNEDTAYRVYGLGFRRDGLLLQSGADAQDAWSKGQAGFRSDWSGLNDSATLQGDLYRATEGQIQEGVIDGLNTLARWQHRSGEQSQLQIQFYYDYTGRFSSAGNGSLILHTYDLDIQQTLRLGSAHALVLGLGERVNTYDIGNTSTLLFLPEHRALTLSNVFLRDTIALSSSLDATIGVKLEDDPFWGWSVLPDVRLSWAVSKTSQVWMAGSRAVRSPTPFDVDVVEKQASTIFLTGNPQFHPETVSAFEIGYRAQPATNLTLSTSAFYNVYDDLRTVDPAPGGFIPLQFGNELAGDTYGFEAWANLQLTDWWRLGPGFGTLQKRLHFKPGASGLLGVAQSGDDPSGHATLTSSMDFGRGLSMETSLRYVSSLPNPSLPGYYELGARVGWKVSHNLELALVGSNLLHARHLEYPAPDGEEILRSVMAQAQWSLQ
jgi:iron complex outermembrane receptor protein